MVNKPAMRLWVAGLESGEFPQGREELCKAGRYCCLGVASVIAHRQEIIPTLPWQEERGSINRSITMLTPPVKAWYGLGSVDPAIGWQDDDLVTAVFANDDLNWTFAEIARSLKEYYQL